MAPLRTVLVLHGYTQNASIFSKRLGALRRECADSVELVFIDAPHILRPADIPGMSLQPSEMPQMAAETSKFDSDPSATPRAWWRANEDKTVAYGLKESIEVIRDLLHNRKFDGIFGFSQGAAFATIISALLERPHLYEPFLIDGKAPHPPFKFCVAASGFRLRDTFCDPLFDSQYSTPTLHVIGKNDVIVHEERSSMLVKASSVKRVEQHDGGHFIPSKRQWLRFLRDWMTEPSADLPSPSLSSAVPSATNSGTATPTNLPEDHKDGVRLGSSL